MPSPKKKIMEEGKGAKERAARGSNEKPQSKVGSLKKKMDIRKKGPRKGV